MSILDRVVSERVPHWTCPVCQTTFFGAVSKFISCPHCAGEKEKAEKEYWDKKVAGQKLVAQSIVSQILAKKSNMEG